MLDGNLVADHSPPLHEVDEGQVPSLVAITHDMVVRDNGSDLISDGIERIGELLGCLGVRRKKNSKSNLPTPAGSRILAKIN